MPNAQKLTFKQERFTQEYLKNNGNGTQAALVAYNTEDTRTAAVTASENLRNPNIQQRIDQILSTQRLTLDQNLGNLVKLANHEPEKISDATVLNANLTLLKLRGADPGTKHTTFNVSFKAKLKEMKFQDLKGYVEAMRA